MASDINIHHLRILNVLFEELHVSRTADRLDISQSSVSKALATLRQQFGDALVSRDRNGYVITSKGRSVQSRIPSILVELDELQAELSRDPTRLNREFRISMADDAVQIMLPAIVGRLTTVAPSLRLTITGNLETAFEELQSGKIDLAIDAPPGERSSLLSAPVTAWGWRCLRGRHADHLSELTLSQYLKSNHGLVSFSGDNQGIVDALLLKQNMKRRVSMVVPYFSAIPSVLERVDVVFTVPEPVAHMLGAMYPLTVCPVPLEMQALPISAVWHPRQQYDQVHRWIREQVIEAITA